MNAPAIKVMLAEDHPGDAHLIQTMLTDNFSEQFNLISIQPLAETSAGLSDENLDVLLLACSSATGLDTLSRLLKTAPDLPIVVLSDDEGLAIQALRAGAQDYLLKQDLDSHQLSRVLRAAVERHRANRARQTSEAHFRALVEHATDVIMIVAADGTVLYESPSLETLLGYPPEAVQGMNIATLVHSDDVSAMLRGMTTILAQPEASFSLELRRRHADGSWRTLEATLTNLLDQSAIRGLVVNFRDITERKLVEQVLLEANETLDQRVQRRTRELRQTKDHVEAILNNSTDGILLADGNLRIRQANPAFRTLFACDSGQPSSDYLLDFIHEQDASRIVGVIQAEITERTGKHIEVRCIRNDGSSFDAGFSIGYFLEGEAQEGIVCTISDVSERKQSEESLRASEQKFRGLVGAAPIATIITDQAGTITLVNQKSETLFGYTSVELVGQPVEILIAENLHERHIQHRTSYAAAPHVRPMGAGLQLFAQRKDGSKFPVEIELSYIQTGPDLLVITFIVDITERKERERQLRFNASLQDGVSDAVISTDLDYHIQTWNRAAERTYGWSAAEVMGQLSPAILKTEFATGDSAENVRRSFMEQGFWTAEVVQHNKDGHAIQVLSSITLIKDTQGVPIGIVAVNHDVTERHHADLALRESEARYRLLAENIIDLVARIDSMGVYIYVSPSSREVLGYEPEDLLGKSGFEFIHPEDIQDVVSRQTAALNSDVQTILLIYRALHKDGSYVWLETRGQIILAPDKAQPLGFITVSRNITERKAAEEALALSEQRYRLIVNSVWDYAIYVLDPVGRVMSWNYGAEHIKGYRAEEIIGQTFESFYTQADIERGLPQEILHIAEREGHFVGEGWRVRKDGSQFWAEVVVTCLRDSENNSIGFTKIVRDLTERKRIENALLEQRDFLQLVVDNVPDLIMVKDHGGYFQLANNLIAKIYGVSSAEMIGKTDADFNPNHQEVTFFREKDQEAIHSGRPVFIPEEKLFERFYQTSKIPLKQPNGTYDRLLVVASDITERKKAEELLQWAFEQQKELGDLKSRFISMASHEFRTPLATILASAETLSAYRQKMTDAQIDHRINNIRDQVVHLKNIIEDVLQLARMQTGRLDFNPALFDLDGLCRSVIDEFESHPDVTQHLVYRCDEDLWQVKFDKKLMRQIINNLVSNAVKYSPEAKEVFISLEHRAELVVLSVRDQGIGIPEADMKHLYEPFHRASNVGSISGTGLGLAIIKEAVELHGGTIHVESQVGVGTTFVVTIAFS